MSETRTPTLFKGIEAASTTWAGSGTLSTILANNTEIQDLANKIDIQLTTSNPILNPGRDDPFKWEKASPNIKDAIILSTALDMTYSADYKAREEKLIQELSAAKLTDSYHQLMEDLSFQGVATHIENENADGNYHRWYHPMESATVASALTTDEFVKDMISTTFQYHDTIQRAPKTAVLNELESADLLIRDMNAALDTFIEKNENMPTTLSQAIKDYREMIPYMAYKNIVSATTMVKDANGQPTVFMIQKLAIEDNLRNSDLKNEVDKIVNNNTNKVSLRVSLVDSNLPSLNLREVLGENAVLAENFLKNKEFGIAEEMKTLISMGGGTANNDTSVNQSMLLYGNNMRMAPELAEAWNGALKMAKFTYQGKDIDGVEAWNLATEASRTGDKTALNALIGLKSNAELALFDKSIIPKGSTLVDIFTARIGGEIAFASKQAPELYEKLAKKLDDSEVKIDVAVFKNHGERMQLFKSAYENSTPKEKQVSAAALFFASAHQPAVFMVDQHQKCLEHIQKLTFDLRDRKEDLEREIKYADKNIKNQTTQVAGEASTKNINKVLSGLIERSHDNGNEKELAKVQKSLGNLEKAVVEIEKLSQFKPASKKQEVEIKQSPAEANNIKPGK